MPIKKLSIIFAAVALAACGSKPGLLENEFKPKGEKVSVAYLRSLYVTTPVVVGKDIYVEGYVVSDDAFGNFYKTIVVEDETGGILIRAGMERLCDLYPYHNKVTVYCNSLTVGSYGGLVELGIHPGDNTNPVEPVPEETLRSVIVPVENSAADLNPAVLALDNLSPRYLSCYVRLEGVQFVEEELGMTWSEYESDTNRTLVDRSGNTITVRTSRHARFAGHRLPAGCGTIDGVLGYFNGNYQLTVIRPEHALMTGGRFGVPAIPVGRNGALPTTYP